MPALGFAAADIGAAADVGAAVDAGTLGVLDAGLIGGAVPGAVADVGALGAADALGAGAAADIGLGAAGLGDVASTDAAALGVGLDTTGSALGGLGAIGSDVLGPGTLGTFGSAPSTAAADVASLTPGATSLGGGTVGALGGATGAPVSAASALESAANPEDLLAISSSSPVGGPDLTGVGATDFARAGLASAGGPGGPGGLPTLTGDINNPADLGTLSTGGGGGYATGPQVPQLSAPTTTGAVGGGGGAAAAGGGAPPSLGLGPGSVDWNAGLGLSTQGTVPTAAGGGAGGLFGTGISGKDAALYGLAGAPLAMALFQGQPGIPQQTQQSTAVSGAEQAYAQQIIASGGAPNQYQSAQIQQATQSAINAARQQLFNMGVTNPESDSRWPAFMQMIAQQQNAMIAQFQQQNMQNAFAAAGGASSALANAGNVQAQQDAAYTQALQNAMRSAGTTLALGGAFGNNRVQPTVNIG
jgi:hypothetical protein